MKENSARIRTIYFFFSLPHTNKMSLWLADVIFCVSFLLITFLHIYRWKRRKETQGRIRTIDYHILFLHNKTDKYMLSGCHFLSLSRTFSYVYFLAYYRWKKVKDNSGRIRMITYSPPSPLKVFPQKITSVRIIFVTTHELVQGRIARLDNESTGKSAIFHNNKRVQKLQRGFKRRQSFFSLFGVLFIHFLTCLW